MRMLLSILAACASTTACAAAVALAPPAFCFDPSWDTVRVVSAGPDEADGRVRVEIGPDGTLFIMR